jgi:DNA repair protein RadA/Sms
MSLQQNKLKCPYCGASYKRSPGKERCPNCGQYNLGTSAAESAHTTLLDDVRDVETERIKTGPWDVCFGGGIVKSTTNLLGGEPGAGKSTLSLQFADVFTEITKREVLYLATEETMPEVKLRAVRLKVKNGKRIRLLSTIAGNEGLAMLDKILDTHKPAGIILDSLSGLTGHDLDMQVEFCKLVKTYSAKLDAPALIIDHINKDGDFAGLLELQHAVDCTLMFRVDSTRKIADTMTHPDGTILTIDKGLRTLETIKNRHGQAHVAIDLYMTERGLMQPPAGRK